MKITNTRFFSLDPTAPTTGKIKHVLELDHQKLAIVTTGSDGDRLSTWDVVTGTIIHTVDFPRLQVTQLVLLQGGHLLIVSTLPGDDTSPAQGILHFYDPSTCEYNEAFVETDGEIKYHTQLSTGHLVTSTGLQIKHLETNAATLVSESPPS